MDVLRTFEIDSWSGPFAADVQSEACEAIESGKVLFLPRLAFTIGESEQALLTPTISNGKAKNVSLRPSGEMSGTSCTGGSAARLKGMMQRFADAATRFVTSIVPAYAGAIERASTSYRPVEIEGRPASAIHDDTRLHVDAFPSRPMRGRRILRLFSNVHPGGAARIWRVGEPFEPMAVRFMPTARPGSRAQAWLLGTFGVTREIRSRYDGLMLALHDAAKRDGEYQKHSPQTEIAFPAGSTWLCFTDQVMHAARAGQYVLEQTFHLDVRTMHAPDYSPLRVLERLSGRVLT